MTVSPMVVATPGGAAIKLATGGIGVLRRAFGVDGGEVGLGAGWILRCGD
jgi:hypothetical protein